MIFKRRKYIVDKRFQGKFILFFVIISSFISIVATVVFNHIALKRLESIIWSAHISVKTTDEVIGSLFIYVNIIAFLVVSFLLILTGIWMVRKTSGFLYVLSKNIMRVANGDLSVSIDLGQKDEFNDVVSSLNDMIKKLRERFFNIKQQYGEISAYIRDIERTYAKDTPEREDIQKVLKRLETLRENLQQQDVK